MDNVPIQIVDDNDMPLRGASMSEAYKQGLRHRIVHALVRDQDGRILLQRRHANAVIYANCWGTSVAGHVDEGERYDVAIAREMAEELGLTNVKLTDIGDYSSDESVNNYHLKRINKVFTADVNTEVELRLNRDEVAEIQWLSPADIKRLVAERPAEVTDGLREVAKRYL